jgi:hypothetical protein
MAEKNPKELYFEKLADDLRKAAQEEAKALEEAKPKPKAKEK